MDFTRLSFERDKSQPLYGQFVESLRNAIEAGELVDGERLPSERMLADQLKVSRTTIVSAYRELEARGLVRSHVGRGTFVCANPEPSDAPFSWRGKVSARMAQLGLNPSLRHLMDTSSKKDLISFAAGVPALESFPLEEYRKAVDHVLRRQTAAAFDLGPVEGQPLFREAIASRFGTKPERVLVLSGAQQGLNLIARCILEPGDAVIVDRPGYVGALETFRSAGANLVGWDVARSDLGELEDLILRYRAKLIYTNPTFQNPTGRVLPTGDRQDLLKLAARYRIPILEDDAYRETQLDTPPPPSLYQLDKYNSVIYLNTFSKTLAPGLRLGWLAASEYVIDQLASIKYRENHFTEGTGQLIVAELLQSGCFDSHLLRLRKEHARRRNIMAQVLSRSFAGALHFTVPKGGLYFWCRTKASIVSQQLLREALHAGIAFAEGRMFYPDDTGSDKFRLCFTSVPEAKIDEGVRRLLKVFQGFDARKKFRS